MTVFVLYFLNFWRECDSNTVSLHLFEEFLKLAKSTQKLYILVEICILSVYVDSVDKALNNNEILQKTYILPN